MRLQHLLRPRALLAVLLFATAPSACVRPNTYGYGTGRSTYFAPAAYGSGYAPAFVPSWERVHIAQTGASWDMPGRPHAEFHASNANDETWVAWESSVDVGGITFGVDVHDCVGREIEDPARAAERMMAAIRERFGVAPNASRSYSASRTRVVDASFQSGSGARAVVRVIVSRTRAYLLFVSGSAAGMDAQGASVSRLFESLRIDDGSEWLWEAGDGALRQGTWMAARPVGGGFTIEMPGTPRFEEQDSILPSAKASRYVVAPAPGGSGARYTVDRWSFDSIRPPRETISTLQGHLAESMHGTVRETAPAIVDNTGARSLTLDLGAAGTARALLVTTESDAYAITAVLPADANAAARADAERVLSSFHLSR